MKKLFLFLLVWCSYLPVFSQSKTNPDSLAYELQRKKINGMLDERRRKFGLYSESLKKHTGIFGLQTKKDIRRSNEILMDIARTDESIFVQIKILLGYRTYQQQKVQTQSVEIENNSLAYMTTINRLRQQIDTLKQEAIEADQQHEKTKRMYLIVIVLMLGSILFLIYKKRRVSA